ncbi:hypothetical protein A2W48_02115 [Candidatus Giovannonibacteria bacterium RIFCSPHIGHO2_12_44_12]|uniref:Uncharacterized protein n=4 Tax=Candidatus Giovannoniibacteriota TaxID=1752738 RepID=A0A1F5X0M7_9BACT|nr:MAG: hypothetical protein UW71_C0023G0009 [Parcubacteria group bacterium GW2011_GWB1_44_7]OGF73769.1 MAG: hypothetical protein A2W57_01310 [Candidatus Giovannonibacteria bacterium RIFCSPHIGHO2_02_43_16]OGF81444.1 MAG: hypothetical protein A2W48_02115 [Candidatus Giovannonibacteria bacterium RIFCSPHIGHO2_12_44_12]OGF84904.1 MAG: hypothetical protein A2Z63_02230 [Candidatus Giovannonibacteria bacterium RIFCSPLOWO2_02_44_8]OGF93947.1 MAG: hypothetical protein A2Y47_02570 [Candidatus Giovannonib
MATSLQEKKIQEIAERAAIRAVQRVLSDPDFGLELTEGVKNKLRKSTSSKKRTSLAEIKKNCY